MGIRITKALEALILLITDLALALANTKEAKS